PAGISKDARRRLTEYHWPGNVRELRNILERAAILCDGGLITAEHLALTVAAPRPMERDPSTGSAPARASSRAEALAERPAAIVELEALGERAAAVPVRSAETSRAVGPPAGDLNSMERAMIVQALQQARFNKSKAAKALGLTRAQLYVRMRKHGLE